MKIVVAGVSVVITLALAVLTGFMLLVALNGFSEQQGGPGLLLYGVVALVSVILSGVVSVNRFARFTASNKWPRWLAAVLAVVVAVVLSAAVLVGGLIVAVAAASLMRG